MVKKLNLQLLESNIGDTKFFKALVEAHERHSGDHGKLEEALWHALDVGFNFIPPENNLMLVIDGVDKEELRDGESSVQTIRERLRVVTSKHKNIKAIALSREAIFPEDTRVHKLVITLDHVHSDVEHVTEHYLQKYSHFREIKSEFEREKLVEKLVHASKGNFLWAFLTVGLLKRETSQKGFLEAVEAIKAHPKSLDETIDRIIDTLDFKKEDTKYLLSWLPITERPLTTAEIKCLLEVDLKSSSSAERKTGIKEIISSACSSLVVIQNEIVRIRHSAIRTRLIHLQKAENGKLLSRSAAHDELVLRILAYCNFTLTKAYEPTFEYIDPVDVDDLFHKHFLLDYAVRNWTLHFRHSTMHKSETSFRFPENMKTIFPASTQLALLEWTCWEAQSSSHEAISMHTLALRLREAIFTEKHESVLQNLIICGTFHRKLSRTKEAAGCFYRASHVGQAILRKYSTITTTCSTLFLTVTESITVTSRTEIVTRKEEVSSFLY